MSDYGLKPEGFIPKRLDVILSEMNQQTRDIFGESLNLSPSSPDGQINGLNSLSRADLWDLANNVYNAFDPLAAAGIALSRLVVLNGITRKDASFSTATCTFSGVNGTVIPIGFLVGVAGTSNTFEVTSGGVIAGGSVDLPMQATVTGPVSAEIGTLNQIINPLDGLSSVTNAIAADAGRDEENDPQLRARQAISTAQPSQNLLDSLYAALSALTNVKSLIIDENDTPQTNANGTPPHSFHTIIQGGNDVEIADKIYILKTPGVMTYGSTSIPVVTPRGTVYLTNFSRPTLIPIYVVINTKVGNQFPGDGPAKIKAAIIEYAEINFLISGDILRTRLFTPINSIPGHVVQNLFIGTAPNPTGTSDIPIPFGNLGQFLEANITVNLL